jgi:mRNA interferase MazF
LCGVNSQQRHEVKRFDENEDDFAASGLLGASLIRLGFVTVLPQRKIVGSIGLISPDPHPRSLERLGKYLVGQVAT